VGAAEALGGFLQNVLDGAVGIAKHVAVPQADNPPAFAFQKSRSAAIGFALLGMMAAIKLEPSFAFLTPDQ
jgi:hypothetical protein